jgi:hypothetical protein
MAYPPVVGGGHNGCIIHYSRNDQLVPGTHRLSAMTRIRNRSFPVSCKRLLVATAGSQRAECLQGEGS